METGSRDKRAQFKKHFQTFLSLPSNEKLLIFEALVFLLLAKMMLLILPFRMCIRTVKTVKHENNPETGVIKSLKNSIDRASMIAFWENMCLGKSFAARWMLQRRGINSELMIGVRHDCEKKLKAHAWLIAAGIEIVPRGDDYTLMISC